MPWKVLEVTILLVLLGEGLELCQDVKTREPGRLSVPKVDIHNGSEHVDEIHKVDLGVEFRYVGLVNIYRVRPEEVQLAVLVLAMSL